MEISLLSVALNSGPESPASLTEREFDRLMLRWAAWVRRDRDNLGSIASNTGIVAERLRTQIPIDDLKKELYRRHGKKLNDVMNWTLVPWCAPVKDEKASAAAKLGTIERDEIAEYIDAAVQTMREHYNREAVNRPPNHGEWLLLALRLHYNASDRSLPMRRSNASITDELNARRRERRLDKINERTARHWICKAKSGVMDQLTAVEGYIEA